MLIFQQRYGPYVVREKTLLQLCRYNHIYKIKAYFAK